MFCGRSHETITMDEMPGEGKEPLSWDGHGLY